MTGTDERASLEEIFRIIAHQWRQPLSQINALVGSIDNRLYELKTEDSFLQQKLLEIETLTRSMSNSMDDFRLTNQYVLQKISFTEILKSTIEPLLYGLRDKKIELSLNVELTAMLDGDEKLLRQILITLIDNARDVLVERNIYNPKIWLSAYEKEESIFIEVSDNAGGMSKSMMNKIFDSGYTTKHRSEGTGLGLYMAKKLLKDKFDAQLSVKNVDAGVCFIIKLSRY